MVRLKNRWFIVRVDQPDRAAGDETTNITFLPSKRDIFLTLSDAIVESFGITHSGAIRDSKVQLSDNLSRLVLIKTSRSLAPKVRAVLACLTALPVTTKDKAVPVAMSVISEHGSLRTTKRSMITKLRGAYRDHLQRITSTASSDKEKLGVGQSLQNVLKDLHAIDF